MPQTKADRQAAAKKAAATRERNRTREKASERGTKSAASRQGNEARAGATQAKQSANSALGGVTSAAKSLGGAAVSAGKSVATRSRGRQEVADSRPPLRERGGPAVLQPWCLSGCRMGWWRRQRATSVPIAAPSSSAIRKWIPDHTRASTISSRACERRV